MERDHDLIADVYGGHGINRGKDNVRMPSEHQLDRQRRAVRENRVHLQSVIVPAPLQAGGEGAAQR